MTPDRDPRNVFPDGFSRYSLARVQQDDLAVRRKLASELEKVRNHLQVVLEDAHRAREARLADATRRAIDEIDVFETELRAGESGAAFAILTAARSATPEAVAKVVEFDYQALEALDRALATAESVGAAAPDAARALTDLRAMLTRGRNTFKDRRDFLRGIR